MPARNGLKATRRKKFWANLFPFFIRRKIARKKYPANCCAPRRRKGRCRRKGGECGKTERVSGRRWRSPRFLEKTDGCRRTPKPLGTSRSCKRAAKRWKEKN